MWLTSEARKHLLGLEYPALLEAWNAIDRRGKKRPGIRDLAMADRLYLLAQVCHHQDMLGHGMEWLFKRCREVENEPGALTGICRPISVGGVHDLIDHIAVVRGRLVGSAPPACAPQCEVLVSLRRFGC